MAWLQLVRWKNLLIIFMTQLLAWWCVIRPEQPQVLDALHFLFLSLSTVLIAAAGYIINDYFDIKIDFINKPQRVVLEKNIPRKQAILAHTAMNVGAVCLAAAVAAKGGHYEWLLIQLGCTLLLWFYSTHLKRQFVSGNVAVAVLTALTILELVVYEPAVRNGHYGARLATGSVLSRPGWVLVVYAYFAFMLTWMREIVKDMEDLKGDEQHGCVTMPIRMGLAFSARFTAGLAVLAVAPLVAAAAVLALHGDPWLAAYIVLLLVTPIGLWAVRLVGGSGTAHYARCSAGLKTIMLLGVFSLILYYIQLLLQRG